MQLKIRLSRMAAVAALLIITANGCTSSPVEPTASQAGPAGIYIEQVPITDYMRSQVGTPNELSPLAPAEARNVRKVGDHWVCDLNSRPLRFNGASSCWEPQQK